MQCKNRQQGMTLWGLLFVLAVIAFAVFLVFKLFPPYMEGFKVRAALDTLSRQADVATMTPADIRTTLEKRFDIDDVRSVKLNEHLSIESRGRTRVIRINYEVAIPIVANISILLDFDHRREVRSVE